MQDASFSQGDGPLPRVAGMRRAAELIASTDPCVRFRRGGRADAAEQLTKPFARASDHPRKRTRPELVGACNFFCFCFLLL